MAFVRVASVQELREGEMKKVKADGQEVLLARVGGAYYASEARCPHMKGDLSLGVLNGTVLTCPVHGSRFELKDGRVLQWTDFEGLKRKLAMTLRSPRPLRIYPVRVEGGEILVETA